jgi:hyperosmotically inducible periplasmic protein
VNRLSLFPARPLALVLALAMPLAGGCDRLRGSHATGPEESKVALALRVRLELLGKLGVDAVHVEVSTDGGKVRLAGEVKKRATAELASEVAEKVEGVSSVDNQIRVRGAGAGDAGERVDAAVSEAQQELRDAALETKVRLALVDRLGSDGFRIGTDAASGVVTLEFPASVERSRRRDAVKTAEKVEGVTKVVTLDKD